MSLLPFDAQGNGYKKGWGVIFLPVALIFFMNSLTHPFFLYKVKADERVKTYWPLLCT